MKFKKKFGNRRESSPKKGAYLVVLLLIAVFLWLNAEKFIGKIL